MPRPWNLTIHVHVVDQWLRASLPVLNCLQSGSSKEWAERTKDAVLFKYDRRRHMVSDHDREVLLQYPLKYSSLLVCFCNMAVDVMHLDPGQSFAKSAFGGKSRSTEELSREHAYPTIVSPSSSGSPRSVSSLLDLTWAEEEEQQAIDRLQSSRKRLEDEIEVRGVQQLQVQTAGGCSILKQPTR